MRGGQLDLISDRDYELTFFHYNPAADRAVMTAISGVVRAELRGLEAVTSPEQPVASPYDLKVVHFRAGAAASASIVITVLDSEGKGVVATQPQLYIPVRVRYGWFKRVGWTGFLWGLLYLQQYTAAASKGDVQWSTVAALLGLALVTAAFAVFGLKKVL